MKVLVAGASGLIGREVVRLLVEAGHSVRTLSQNAERAERLRALTGDVRIADATKEGAFRSHGGWENSRKVRNFFSL